jgi:hypothetical protein
MRIDVSALELVPADEVAGLQMCNKTCDENTTCSVTCDTKTCSHTCFNNTIFK